MSTRATVALALLLSISAPAAQAADEAAARELPQEARAFVEEVSKSLLKVQDPDAELSCDKAVENATSGLDTMLEVGQRNADDGYIQASDYATAANRLRAFRAQITLDDCQNATGPQREFYRCMSSMYNHVAACAAQLR